MSWGPWIEHDGKGCPLRQGTLGEAVLRCGDVVPFRALCGSTRGGPYVPANALAGSAWVWGSSDRAADDIIRYRVWYPDALEELKRIAAAPSPVDAPSEVA